MPQDCESFLHSLNVFSKKQIDNAGQRYTPGIDQSAPNIKIESLITAIENVACGSRAHARFQSVLDNFSKKWKNAKYYSQHLTSIEQQVSNANKFLSPMMDRLRAGEASAGEEWLSLITSIETDLVEDLKHWYSEEDKINLIEKGTVKSAEYRDILYKINVIELCLNIMRNEKEYGQSPAFKALYDPNLLISGEWGTGKTHLLCDVTRKRIDRKQATILALAKNFRGDIVAEICFAAKEGYKIDEIFNQIERLTYKSKERAIFIIDGINEGDCQKWQKAITIFQSLVKNHPNIGLIISCRTRFKYIYINKKDLEIFHEVVHQGFKNQEFDAQIDFFEYYKLPMTEVPLTEEESSRPFVLKNICKSLQKLKDKKSTSGFAGIASGQVGMTYIIESLINHIGKSIESEYCLGSKGCWFLLKGRDRIDERKIAGFAPCMAENLRDYVYYSEADNIVAANHPKLNSDQRHRLLDDLRINGILEEDVIWCSAKTERVPKIVFRIPYQQFSDHLVARYLLDTDLDNSSEKSIKRSFMGKSNLARMFKSSDRYCKKYAMPNLVQALITEFPTRTNVLPSEQCELFFMLPEKYQDLSAYIDPFIKGILWRNPGAFTEGTRIIIKKYLKFNSRDREQMMDALVAVSTKSNHPYCAHYLYDVLACCSMPDRDLQWTEYLRMRYPAARRLLAWAKRFDVENITQQSAAELVVLFSLVLTTVVRSDRDIVTKVLVLIGEKFPEVLFNHVETSLEFNDPYVPERMLAAAYGTTLSLVDSDAVSKFRHLLGNFSESLYRKMFGPGSENATHHTLMRDYALGIIKVAQSADCGILPETANRDIAFPFPNITSTFTSDGVPDALVDESVDDAIKMDFGNYTIGRLISNRSNYDYENPDYIQICAKIKKRIFDLGYRTERFKDIDSNIHNISWRMRDQDKDKVDRYGKKYSWIAYFEMWGELEASGKLPDWRAGERTSDCGIDPSFPKRPPSWTPPIPDFFDDAGDTTENWVKGDYTPDWSSLLVVSEINKHQGEWILLEGFVLRSDENLDREIFAFLRGLFVARKNLYSLRNRFLDADRLGNDRIPKGVSEIYTYAGEIGHRHRYARSLYRRDTRYRRQVAKAFDEHIRIEKSISPSFGVSVEVPYARYDWGSCHSFCNDFSGFSFPAPSLIQRLDLSSKNREIDFYDSMGKFGTLYREAGNGWNGDHHKLLYIRADLLRRYLRDTRQVLVWCNWGKRDWFKKTTHFRDRIVSAYKNTYRSFNQWSAKDCDII